jgi:hypothetical protein
MGTLELRSEAPDRARELVRQAIERERRLIADGIGRTRERIVALAGKTGIDLQALQAGQVFHPEARDMELLELEGEIEILALLEEQFRVVDGLQICP